MKNYQSFTITTIKYLFVLSTTWIAIESTFTEKTANGLQPVVHSEHMLCVMTGDVLIVQGRVNKLAQEFSVDLIAITEKNNAIADIVLHINPRFALNQIYINNHIAGSWGTPETLSPISKFNLTEDAPYAVEINVGVNSFKIMINNIYCCELFSLRLLSDISSLRVQGDVTVKNVQVGLPAYHSLRKPSMVGNRGGDVYVRNLFPVLPGDHFVVQGRTNDRTNRFSINLITTSNTPNWVDEALHVNPRVLEKVLVLDTCVDKVWLNAIVEDVPFPLTGNGVYSISIVVGNTSFSVQVNGFQYNDYDFRIPMEKIYGIEVFGDLTVDKVIVSQIHPNSSCNN